jgi:hypothetical protein
MTQLTTPGYVLLDPRPIAAEAPYTFFIPNETERAAISTGDLVQLMFEHVPTGQEWGVERMWVVVNGINAGEITGTLVSNPSEPSASIRGGDQITFTSHLVIGISWANPETAPRSTTRRDYWERCWVDDCVLDGSRPVGFLYREEPDSGQEGDKYPDSGWRIRGRVINESNDEYDGRTAQYVAIGAVLNEDDSWLHLLDAPIGARLIRDFQTNTYVAQGS